MLRTRLDPGDTKSVDLDGVQDVSMRVLLGRGDGMPNFALRHFVVDPGGHTPHHRHDYEHQVVVLEGSGEADSAEGVQSISKGDVLYIAADELHQFRNSGTTSLQFLCLVPLSRRNGEEVPGS